MAAFSVTERQNAKRCPRMHRLSAKGGQHLGLMLAPVYLNVGTLIHKGSQAWLLDTERKMSYEDHVTLASVDLLEKVQQRYLKQVGAPISAEEEEPLYEAIHFARTMAKNYEARWGTPLPDGFTLIRPEQHVMVPVPGTEHRCEQCHGQGLVADSEGFGTDCPRCGGDRSFEEYHYLDGRFDGLIQDAAGRIHILEHKTYNARPNAVALQNNDQFLGYMWLAIQLGIGDVAGLAYDGLWRRDKVPRGRTFEDLFLRHEITRSRAELLEFQRMLPNELNMMAAQLALPEDPYINRRWMGCFDCSFDDKKTANGVSRTGLCSAISRGENVDAVRNLYYTTRDDDTEDDDPSSLEADA